MNRIVLLIVSLMFVMIGQSVAQISMTPAGFLCDRGIYQESFENGVPAGWTGLKPDSAKLAGFNEGWVLDRDMTFSANTGPNAAQDGSFYVYCDGSGPIARGATAVLLSPVINVGNNLSPALVFRLNMFGQSGELSVSIIDGGVKKLVVGPISGAVPGGIHTADQWEEVFVDLDEYKNKSIQLEFSAMKPSDASIGDIAIDNIQICSSSNAIPTLSQWSILVVGLMLLIFGVVRLRSGVLRQSVL